MTVEFVLIGPPGSGKSSVGKALAKRTGGQCIDTDQLVEKRTGKTISEIFLEDGETRFRELESLAVADAMESNAEIVALGGGAILDYKSHPAIQSANQVVFLDVSISNASPRIGFNRDRPLLLMNPRQQWLELMSKRRPIYERLATMVVSTDRKKPDQVASEILERVGK